MGAASIQSIDRCRICGGRQLAPVLDLGSQYLTGTFPRDPGQKLTRGPLELVKCHAPGNEDACGLLQLRHTYDLKELYGEGYGYRSGLNRSMVDHLGVIVKGLRRLTHLKAGDVVLDIGSNDGTLLSFYPAKEATLVGMDPTGAKFREFYRADIQLVPDFFSARQFGSHTGGRKARIVTSIAMFYDLFRPMDFMRDVADVLEEEGVWHLEQSYLPLMIRSNAYDTVCHEHLEYYALGQILWMAGRTGLKIVEVNLSDTNGGSFGVTLAKTSSRLPACDARVGEILRSEREMGLGDLAAYEKFRQRIQEHRDALLELLGQLRSQGRRVLGYGASTKGNVILQYCGLTPKEIPYIAEVNPDKFGRFTPGTNIPIISEAQARAMKPDCFLVLPWHFRKNLLQREQAFLQAGGKMIFPLPEIQTVSS